MSREDEFARQLCRVLDRGNLSLDRSVAERLRAARERALERRLTTEPASVMVGAGGTALLAGDRDKRPVRTALGIFALLFAVGFAYYWNGYSQASENEAIDSALLSRDLPPTAYLDKGFQAWLQESKAAGE